MIKPGVYKHIGEGINLKGFHIKNGDRLMLAQQGMQKWNNEYKIKIIITTHPVAYKQYSYLYQNEQAFYKNWRFLYE